MSERYRPPHPEQVEDSPSYRYFDPAEEMAALKARLEAMPKEEREAAREESFDQLRTLIGAQRLEIAEISAEVEDALNENPDANADELMSIVQKTASEARLSPGQIQTFEQRISRMVEANDQIRETVAVAKETYGTEWQKGLFGKYFTVTPQSKISVSTEQGAIFFHVTDPQDWRRTGKALKKRIGTMPKCFAFMLSFKDDPDQKFFVGAESPLSHAIPGHIPAMAKVHELRHAKDNIIEPSALDFLDYEKKAASELSPDSTPDEVETFIKDSISELKDAAFISSRSEILAFIDMSDFMLDNASKAEQIFELVAVAIYDLLNNSRITGNTKSIAVGMTGESGKLRKNAYISEMFLRQMQTSGTGYHYGDRARDLINHQIEKNTGSNHYSRLVNLEVEEAYQNHILPQLKNSIQAAVELQDTSGLNSHQVMWLLENEPMQYWPALADRVKKAHDLRQEVIEAS